MQIPPTRGGMQLVAFASVIGILSPREQILNRECTHSTLATKTFVLEHKGFLPC
jgi:hypothetical protein